MKSFDTEVGLASLAIIQAKLRSMNPKRAIMLALPTMVIKWSVQRGFKFKSKI